MSSGSRSRGGSGVGAGILLVALLGSPLAAQQCPAAERVGWMGISGLACNCTVRAGEVPVWSFRSEPRVTGLERGSPAAGVLQPGDEILAVNGMPITTPEAGRLYGAPDPGEPLRLTVRRDGRTRTVELTPAAVCATDERVQGQIPVVPRAPAPVSRPRQPAPPAPAVGAVPRVPRVAPAPDLPTFQPPVDAGWFGFGIRCSRCGVERSADAPSDRWFFEENPVLMLVEAGSPADRAGLREGDELVAIDGTALRTEDGGRRFGAVEPGQTVRWTYRRDGREQTVTVTARERPLDPAMARMATMLDSLSARIRRGERVPADFLRQFAPAAAPEPSGRRRFLDTVGNVEVEVTGDPSIVTTIVEPGRDLIIDTGNARIRVRTTAARRD